MSISDTWNTTFDAAPAGGDDLSLGDDKIRETRRATRERGEREHLWASTDTNSKHGWHREGSARAFVADTEPSAYNDPDGTAIGGDATLDQGRLFFDSEASYLPRVYDGGWKKFLRHIVRGSIQGNLVTGSAVLPPIAFGRAVQVAKVVARVGTAPTTNTLLIDINEGSGGTSIFATGSARIAIQPGATGASSASFTGADLTEGNWLEVDIDQVGEGSRGADLGLSIEALI